MSSPIATSSDASALRVRGRCVLRGEVAVSGFKHSMVTVACAASAARARLVLRNCPDIGDTRVLAALIRACGGDAKFSDSTLTLDARSLSNPRVDGELASSVHGSVYLVPGLLARFGHASLHTSGGCQIGDGPGGQRPFAHYISVLSRFGAGAAIREHGDVYVTAKRLLGCDLDMCDYMADPRLRTGPLYSGASKMSLLTAALAHGTSRIWNLYPKPDVRDLVKALQAFGAEIDWLDESSVQVHGRGPEALCRDAVLELMPDLIEVVTWLCVGATICEQGLRIRGTGMSEALSALEPELQVLRQFGVKLRTGADSIDVDNSARLTAAPFRASSCSVYSDSQPFLTLLATHASGETRVEEEVWSNRFQFATELCKLGADISVGNNWAVVRGPSPPSRPDQVVRATDLRAASVLLIAALAVPGWTTIENTGSLSRGYQDLPGMLTRLGAQIEACHA